MARVSHAQRCGRTQPRKKPTDSRDTKRVRACSFITLPKERPPLRKRGWRSLAQAAKLGRAVVGAVSPIYRKGPDSFRC